MAQSYNKEIAYANAVIELEKESKKNNIKVLRDQAKTLLEVFEQNPQLSRFFLKRRISFDKSVFCVF